MFGAAHQLAEQWVNTAVQLGLIDVFMLDTGQQHPQKIFRRHGVLNL